MFPRLNVPRGQAQLLGPTRSMPRGHLYGFMHREPRRMRPRGHLAAVPLRTQLPLYKRLPRGHWNMIGWQAPELRREYPLGHLPVLEMDTPVDHEDDRKHELPRFVNPRGQCDKTQRRPTCLKLRGQRTRIVVELLKQVLPRLVQPAGQRLSTQRGPTRL